MNATLNILLEEAFLSSHQALFAELVTSVAWDDSMRARKTASFGKAYDYSQMTYAPQEMPGALMSVQQALADRLGFVFNNCLLNYYESGDNTMGYHADAIDGLEPGVGVAIVSLGSERTLSFRSHDCLQNQHFSLSPGSLFYMPPEVQTHWRHAVRRAPGAGPRISLTWRAIRTKEGST